MYGEDIGNKKQVNIRDIFPRWSKEDMAEDMAEPVGWFSMSVLLMHATHPTEVCHEMLERAAVMKG